MAIQQNILPSKLMLHSGLAISQPVSPLQITTEEDSDFCSCTYQSPEFVERVFYTTVPNLGSSDKSAFVSRYFASGKGNFYLKKSDDTEILLENYQEKTEVIKGYKYVICKILWSDIASEFGVDDYRIIFKYNNFSNTQDYTNTIKYHKFQLMPFSHEAANNTIVFRYKNSFSFDNSEFDYNNYQDSKRKIEFNFRLPASIISIEPVLENETYLTSSRQEQLIQSTIYNKYSIEFSELLPAKIIQRLYSSMLNLEVEIFDYNLQRYRQEKTSSYKVNLDNIDELKIFEGNSNSKLSLTFRDSNQSYKKRWQ